MTSTPKIPSHPFLFLWKFLKPSPAKMERGSILESIGSEIIGVMSPVSICMFLVVLLVYSTTTSSSSAASTVRTAANLVYLESPNDTTSQKLEGALLNALVFVVLIALVTFLLVVLYYYQCTNFLKHYTRVSAFFVLAFMGGPIFLTIIQKFSIPVDSVSCFLLLLNFAVLGVLSIFSNGVPILLKQSYMVSLGIIVAAWLTRLPEWTTWALLVALALYDLVAVLAPGGPLKILVELASSREEELPALVYEARPANVSRNGGPSLDGLLFAGVSRSNGNGGSAESSAGVELQALSSTSRSDDEEIGNPRGHLFGDTENVNDEDHENEIEVVRDDQGETSPLMAATSRRSPMAGSDGEIRGNTSSSGRQSNEVSLVDMIGGRGRRDRERNDDEMEEMGGGRGIKLGLGDFVFYSVLVGRAAMYDLMTVYACYLAIISGLGCTLILLAVCRHALPALPISIALGVMFYFLTRLLMEPFVVGISTNLMML